MRSLFFGIVLATVAPAALAEHLAQLPHLQTQGTATQLIVEGEPYLILGGELGNSSASDPAYLTRIWPTLAELNLNTVLVPVYWELVEPREGRFDFSLVDTIISKARAHDMRLVLLWFGSWKNSMSCYVPGWVKTDAKRFPRARDATGQALEMLTAFAPANLQADLRAYCQLMRHLSEVDSAHGTVIMVQVENEIGMIPSARDHCELATRAFHSRVPSALLEYLARHEDDLSPEVAALWRDGGCKTQGTWEEVFGPSPWTDELFMAWHYATYVEEIVSAGRAEHDIPVYVNAALIREGYQPGRYPSAGPLPHLLDIWRAGAPSVDLFSPDIYFPELEKWCTLYHQKGNPLFVPEARREPEAAVKALYVFGAHDAMGFSPFSIESTDTPEDDPIGAAYAIIGQLRELILAHQGQGRMIGVLLDHTTRQRTAELGGYELTVRHDGTLPWSVHAEDDVWPLTGCMIINTAENEYYVAGTGVVVTFATAADEGATAGILRIDEGTFIDGKWVPGRRMNGDQNHQGRHLRIPAGEYGIQKVELYTY